MQLVEREQITKLNEIKIYVTNYANQSLENFKNVKKHLYLCVIIRLLVLMICIL